MRKLVQFGYVFLITQIAIGSLGAELESTSPEVQTKIFLRYNGLPAIIIRQIYLIRLVDTQPMVPQPEARCTFCPVSFLGNFRTPNLKAGSKVSHSGRNLMSSDISNGYFIPDKC